MRKLAGILVTLALLVPATAQATDYGSVDPGEALRIPCWMPGKNAHVYTMPYWGSRPLLLEGYYPGSEESWVEYWGLQAPTWHATVTSDKPYEGPQSLAIKTIVHNDGLRRITFSGTCTIWAPGWRHRR